MHGKKVIHVPDAFVSNTLMLNWYKCLRFDCQALMWKEQIEKNTLCAVRLYKRLEIEWDLELVPSIKDMQKYNSLATVLVIVSYRQRALPDNMIIWEQSLSVQYTVQAVNVFVTLVSDNYCILRNHLAIIQLVALFQTLFTDNIM